jgi:hypothetical protein
VGFHALYALGGRLGSVERVSTWLPYVLLLVSAGAVAAAACRFAGLIGAFSAFTLCVGSDFYLAQMSGGLPRGFGFPILAGALAGLCYGQPRVLALAVWLGAGFYPVSAVPVALALAGLLLLVPAHDRGEARSWSLRQRILFLGLTAMVTLIILLPPVVGCRRYGPMLSEADSADFPEAGFGGRYGGNAMKQGDFTEFFEENERVLVRVLPGAGEPWVPHARAWLLDDASGERLERSRSMVVGIAALGWLLLAFRRSGARRALLILAAGAVGYYLAGLFRPWLYFQDRYVQYVLPPFLALMLGAGAAGFVEASGRLTATRWPRLLVVGGVCATTLLLFAGRGSPRGGLSLYLDPDAAVYRFLRQLPADALVAGWPGDPINNVPCVARRAAFVTFETHQAYHPAYVLEMRRRMVALIDAYFATTLEPLTRLRNEFGVTHLIIDLAHLDAPAPRYFAPFNAAIEAAVERRGGRELEVVRHLDSAGVFKEKNIAVIDLSRVSTDPGETRSIR